jgi:superfamily II DNA or RNA helicase
VTAQPEILRLRPRPGQTEALVALERAFAVADRAQLALPCGSGKTPGGAR